MDTNYFNGPYEPTLQDCIQIYNSYSVNTGEIASCLSDVYKYLSRDLISTEYKGGEIWARAEWDQEEELPTIHYIFKNDTVLIDNKITCLDEDVLDMDLKRLIATIKSSIREDLTEYDKKE